MFVLSDDDGGVSNVIIGEKGVNSFLNEISQYRIVEGGAAEEMAQEIALYLDGRINKFDTEIKLGSGTPFQRAVWKRLLDIPYGEVITYKELAECIGRPNSARAVGNAVGANPIPIVIPCHRVLAANGLGGYASGIHIKKDLLKIEGVFS